MLEQGNEFLTDDLHNTSSIQASAADCANKCQQYSGKPRCTAWTWHHPTAASKAGSCHLKAQRPDSMLEVRRNQQAVSGSLLGEATIGYAWKHIGYAYMPCLLACTQKAPLKTDMGRDAIRGRVWYQQQH
jgi:hypothetical protein